MAPFSSLLPPASYISLRSPDISSARILNPPCSQIDHYSSPTPCPFCVQFILTPFADRRLPYLLSPLQSRLWSLRGNKLLTPRYLLSGFFSPANSQLSAWSNFLTSCTRPWRFLFVFFFFFFFLCCSLLSVRRPASFFLYPSSRSRDYHGFNGLLKPLSLMSVPTCFQRRISLLLLWSQFFLSPRASRLSAIKTSPSGLPQIPLFFF